MDGSKRSRLDRYGERFTGERAEPCGVCGTETAERVVFSTAPLVTLNRCRGCPI